MFKAGDLVELDLESDVNLDYDGTLNPDDMGWLATKGVYPNVGYEVKEIISDEGYEEYYLKLLIKDVDYCFISERFKLSAPLSLENE